MDKTVFTSKDIERAFGIPNREQIYWVDKGYIAPDVQSERPRIFSSTQAVSAGFIRFFQNQGYQLERAARLAKIASSVSLYAIQTRGQFQVPPQSRMVIKNGWEGTAEIVFKSENEVLGSVYFLFSTSSDLENGEGGFFAGDRVSESVCSFEIDAVARRLCACLGLDVEVFTEFPQDPAVKILMTDDRTRSFIGISGDAYLVDSHAGAASAPVS